MALPATAVWEVRTTGSDANGGAFDPSVTSPGTDYSQQDAAQVTYTDMVIGATTTQLTSAGNPFAAAHVGNTLTVTGGTGFTAGRYSVRSVASGVATMDRAVGTAASTGGTGNLGGALASPGMAAGAKVGGNVVWLKYSAAGWTAGGTANVSGGKVADAAAGASGQVSRWVGYEAARGDGCPTGNRPTVNAGAASQTVFAASGAYVCVENLQVANPSAFASTVGFAVSGNFASMRNLVASGMKGTGVSLTGAGQWLADSLVTGGGSGGNGVELAGNAGRAVRCVVLSWTGTGFSYGGGTYASYLDDCLAASCSGAAGGGFVCAGTQAHTLRRCVAYGNTQHGFQGSNLSQILYESCVAASNGGYGFTNTAGAAALQRLHSCAGHGNTSGNYLAGGFASDAVVGFKALTAGPFTNPAGLDFTPNATAGGGAVLRAAGPPSLPGLAGTSYPDIGAFQSQGSSGGVVPRIGSPNIRGK